MSTQHAASGIPKFSSQQLAYLATLKQDNVAALDAITNGTHPMCALMAQSAQTPAPVKPTEPVTLPKVGDVVEGRGVYLGPWEAAAGYTVHAYAAEDFLRKPNGEQLVLTFNEAQKEFAKRNGDRRYGEGTEANIRQAIKTGFYQDGDPVLPTRKQLQEQIVPLIEAGKLPKVAAAVHHGERNQRWALSGSEPPVGISLVYHVRLADGDLDWDFKDFLRSGVVPVRYYRNGPSAPPPTPGG